MASRVREGESWGSTCKNVFQLAAAPKVLGGRS
jgi:hypothetical protein